MIAETNTQPREVQSKNPDVSGKLDSTPEEGKKFSVSMFPIEQTHKVNVMDFLHHRQPSITVRNKTVMSAFTINFN